MAFSRDESFYRATSAAIDKNSEFLTPFPSSLTFKHYATHASEFILMGIQSTMLMDFMKKFDKMKIDNKYLKWNNEIKFMELIEGKILYNGKQKNHYTFQKIVSENLKFCEQCKFITRGIYQDLVLCNKSPKSKRYGKCLVFAESYPKCEVERNTGNCGFEGKNWVNALEDSEIE